MTEYQIALLKGDGIGPEIVESATAVLKKTGELSGFSLNFHDYLIGGIAIDETGVPLPQETIDGCLASDSVLLGAVGGPKWDNLPAAIRPEKGLLQIRSTLGLYTNLRPARLYPALAEKCMLRADLVADGFDLVIVRELTGGIYFGERGRRTGPYGPEAYDTECYSVMEIERIARVACSTAQKRRGKVTSVDKANVLESSRLWRETVHRIAEEYEGITVEDMLVDNTAQQLIRNPSQFDVIVTSNMFGDILSDEMSQLTGSIGMLPSASLGDGTRGLYEPIHGSAPKYAGTGRCNPIATILSGAMMLRYSLNQAEAADRIEAAVDQALRDGCRTRDIADDDNTILSCDEMTEAILQRL
ncbi:MAG: 3-isopropylmalate dehydrogenase [Oscillospiraceae bacterium]|nr:3-isopropylmalate dehydrogenase [Oscillospiraceae bacterium]